MAYRAHQASEAMVRQSRTEVEESYRYGYLTLPAPPKSDTIALCMISVSIQQYPTAQQVFSHLSVD